MPDLFSDECFLNRKEIEKYVRGDLGGRKADVIVGVSMGGLIAPSLAVLNPEAKFILIGTGPYFETSLPFYNFMIRLESRDPMLFLIRLVRAVPGWLYLWIYRRTHQQKYALSDEEYRRSAGKSWEAFAKISLTKMWEILRLVAHTDNTRLLKKLPNKTLIFSGSHDTMMPLRLSQKMNGFISRSTIIVLDRLHYDMFTTREYEYVEKFLS
ncbi:MAG: hypothetical protein UW22_C0027G0004 [Candidatus Gottesmanbacteria bacterium GW2011_GWB1_44_11c]|uniref:Serine aminopeptidase S33 domain-containing protein n=1 Tax=Candidatus Gottesmanbacteria bacterium GW2011_GWB1_44_11c TaxID=1618447 RepID=A0A0G1GQL7_9BACT|nr:MAG: hypothetical protein UW22_C0027G0004 [Candidatus Gottesmanbacteria bacterium GW2011_GWB1_44_11c]